MAHAILSPSGASRWMRCVGAPAMERDRPEAPSKFAAEGTAAHTLAAWSLTSGTPTAAYVGRIIEADGFDIEVTQEMADYVQQYVDLVHTYVAPGCILLIEQSVSIGHVTTEDDARGTADAIVIAPDGSWAVVIDLKYGKGVAVSAVENEQEMIYSLGVIDLLTMMGHDPQRVRLVIHQPRVQHTPSEWECDVSTLTEFAERVTATGSTALTMFNGEMPVQLAPGEKQCKFCKAKPVCPALAEMVADTTLADFADLTQATLPVPPALADALAKVDLIEEWCAAIRGEAFKTLSAGGTVPGYHLVVGKKGARAWKSSAEAEQVLQSVLGEQAFDRSLISPTSAEKLCKKAHATVWDALQVQITQPVGKPVVAPVTDKRQAYTPAADFEDETGGDLL